MKYNELFTTGNGLFAKYFATDYPTEFKAIFGEWKASDIDNFAILKYGTREVLESVNTDNVQSYVDALISLNTDRWQNVMKVLDLEYDVLKPLTRETTTTLETNTTTSESNESNNAQKAFNDETFTDGERGTDSRSQNRQDSENRTSSVIGVGSGKTYSEVIKKEKELRVTEYRQSIVSDLIKEITLQIY